MSIELRRTRTERGCGCDVSCFANRDVLVFRQLLYIAIQKKYKAFVLVYICFQLLLLISPPPIRSIFAISLLA